MVARNRNTYTCTVGQIVVVVAVVAKRKTSTQIVAVVAINQSIKTPFTRESTVYTGLDKVLNGRIVSLYNPFTRNRANSVTVLLIQVRTNFCQSQLWNGFLIKGVELRSKLLTRKLFHEPVKIFDLLLIR